MSDGPFFGLDGYHVTLAATGSVIILAYWLPRLMSKREPAASALLIGLGAVSFAFIPGLPTMIDPRDAPRLWELTSEVAVIIALFGAGLKIDRLDSWSRWSPAIRLLAIAMPLTILATSMFGYWFGGLTFAASALIGAVLAPTDPVLAGDIQVGPPTEGGEHPVRFSLTAEAGLNDGLAFPFVYLGILLATVGYPGGGDLLNWFLIDIVYRIAVGSIAGAFVGWLLGRILFAYPSGNSLAATGSAVVAIAGVLLTYGATELVEGYGFIACFVSGIVLRRVEREHAFHGKLHDFNEAIEHALTAILLVLIGGVLPSLLQEMRWRDLGIALSLIFIIRPVAAFLAMAGSSLQGRNRLIVSFYGVRGIGSIYYLAYAATHIEFEHEGRLWAIVAVTILISSLVHGLTAGRAVEQAEEARS